MNGTIFIYTIYYIYTYYKFLYYISQFIFDIGYEILDIRYWILCIGYQIVDSRYQVLDIILSNVFYLLYVLDINYVFIFNNDIILHCIIFRYVALYHFIHYSVFYQLLDYIIFYYILLYSIIFYSTTLYCIFNIVYCSILHVALYYIVYPRPSVLILTEGVPASFPWNQAPSNWRPSWVTRNGR